MSLRGFKRDRISSAHVLFLDKRSFMSQVKKIGSHGGIHFILFGKDKAPVRAEIFRRNREANGGENRCWNCGTSVFEVAPDEFCFAYVGEWDHIRNGAGERCDCPENGRVACRRCHRERHPQPRFRRTRQEQMAETE